MTDVVGSPSCQLQRSSHSTLSVVIGTLPARHLPTKLLMITSNDDPSRESPNQIVKEHGNLPILTKIHSPAISDDEPLEKRKHTQPLLDEAHFCVAQLTKGDETISDNQ